METNTGIIENNRTQMRRGVLEYSILLILASGDEYASSIIQKMKDVNIIVAEGTIYPLLIVSVRTKGATQISQCSI